MCAASDSHCLVADDGGIMCGYVLTFINGNEAFLRDLFIDPPHQRRGIGTQLFNHAIAYAGDRGATRLILHADPNAEPFYEHLGMRSTGSAPSNIIEGRSLPIMHLDLTR